MKDENVSNCIPEYLAQVCFFKHFFQSDLANNDFTISWRSSKNKTFPKIWIYIRCSFVRFKDTLPPRNSDDCFKAAQKYLCIKKTAPRNIRFPSPWLYFMLLFLLSPLNKTTYFVRIENASAELLCVAIPTQNGFLNPC